jgi:hypothetical protein
VCTVTSGRRRRIAVENAKHKTYNNDRKIIIITIIIKIVIVISDLNAEHVPWAAAQSYLVARLTSRSENRGGT